MLSVYDGFEGSSLSAAWDRSRFVPGRVVIESRVVSAGHGAAAITVQHGDEFEAGRGGDSDSERSELLEARALTSHEDATYEQSFSVYLPRDFPVVPVRLVIAQWKQYCPADCASSDDSPVLAIRYVNGVLRITQDIQRKQTVLFQKRGEQRGRWMDFRFRVRFSSRRTGHVEAWLNGERVVNFAGVTANTENAATGYPDPSYFYFKMGLYRNVMRRPMTIYVDEYHKRELRESGQ